MNPTSAHLRAALDALQAEVDECKVKLNDAQRRFHATRVVESPDGFMRLERAYRIKQRQLKALTSALKKAKALEHAQRVADNQTPDFWVLVSAQGAVISASNTQEELLKARCPDEQIIAGRFLSAKLRKTL